MYFGTLIEMRVILMYNYFATKNNTCIVNTILKYDSVPS